MSANQMQLRPAPVYILMAVLSLLVVASCRSTESTSGTRQEHRIQDQRRTDRGWRRANKTWEAASYPTIKVSYPTVLGAEFVNEDKLCQVCHKLHVEAFEYNVHRQNNCESCHGPASKHLETRGKQPGLILNFKALKRAERAEVCAKCHEKNACGAAADWRTSAHAHHGVDCTQCHISHYNVPEGTSATTVGDVTLLPDIENWQELVARLRDRDGESTARTVFASHSSTASEELPSGSEAEAEAEAEAERASLRGTSNNLGAVVPTSCYRCHTDKYELEQIAHPHQINGPNGFNCTTCHDPHGNVLATSRKELCLECHKGANASAWHSSLHDQVGVACTDCHNPHPSADVLQQVNVSHTSIRRPPRLPMSVDEPEACYKCHPKIRGLTHLPSHHPIIEGKLTCSDCHNAHGQAEGNLREETVNMVCYKCHAEKQGPFVYEHPPVNEDCSICHEPHGTVANNLLRQPATFLCLRCHAGHRAPPSDHFGIGTSDIDGNPSLLSVFYSDCTQCHQQVHGSDHPSQQRTGAFLR